jgi:hypothetical protein
MRRCSKCFPLGSDLRYAPHVCINKRFTLTQVVMKHDLTVSCYFPLGGGGGLNTEVQCPVCRPSPMFSFVWKFWGMKLYVYLLC